MKRVSIVMLLLALTMWTSNDLYASGPKTETTAFWVSIHCGSCQQRIMENLPFEKGVKDIKIDLETRRVEVTYDIKKTNSQKICQAIEKLGYEVRILGPDEELKAPIASGTCCGGHVKTDGSHACNNTSEAGHKCAEKKGDDHKCDKKKDGDHKCEANKGEGQDNSDQKRAEHKCEGHKSEGHKCSGHKEPEHK